MANNIIDLKQKPSFVTEIKDQRVALGEPLVFECEFVANPAPGNYFISIFT